MTALLDEHDDKRMRCPRVGGEVNFQFCRSENNMLPCRFITGCWQREIEITAFLEEHFSEEELNRIFSPPRPKMETLVALMEKAKKSK